MRIFLFVAGVCGVAISISAFASNPNKVTCYEFMQNELVIQHLSDGTIDANVQKLDECGAACTFSVPHKTLTFKPGSISGHGVFPQLKIETVEKDFRTALPTPVAINAFLDQSCKISSFQVVAKNLSYVGDCASLMGKSDADAVQRAAHEFCRSHAAQFTSLRHGTDSPSQGRSGTSAGDSGANAR